MLERAKIRRELLDERMTNAGHDVRARRSPLRDANVFSTAIAQKSPAKNVTTTNATVAPKASSGIIIIFLINKAIQTCHKFNLEKNNNDNNNQLIFISLFNFRCLIYLSIFFSIH